MKEYLKPRAYKQSEPSFEGVTACLLKNEPASQRSVARLTGRRVAVAKASLNRAFRVAGPGPEAV